MPSFTRVTYSGATPGADAATYNLYSSVNDGGANGPATKGQAKFILDLKNSQAGTLKAYKSIDRGVTWNQIYQTSVVATATTASNQYEFDVEPFADWKLDWVNGGVAQATWLVDMALSPYRSQFVIQNPAVAVDDVNGKIVVEHRYSFLNITLAAPTTTVVKSGAGLLHAITINTIGATGTITMYDNTAASGTKIGTITLPAAGAGDMPTYILYDVSFATGLTIVTATAANDITVSYR